MSRIVDVSNNNGRVDFTAVKAAGAVGVWLKVTEGATFVDPDYRENDRRARAAGLRVGGYHFGHAGGDGTAQAEFFLSHLNLHPGDLLPVLDLEEQGRDGQPAPIVAAYAGDFLDRLRSRVHARGMLYAGSYFIRDFGLARLRVRRWIPSYGARPRWYTWAAWQFTDGQLRYPGSILGLDTSRVPILRLVTYRPRRKRRRPLSRWQLAHPKHVLANDSNLSAYQRRRLRRLAAKS